MYFEKVRCFGNLIVSGIEIEKRRISGTVHIDSEDGSSFKLIFTYGEDIEADLNTAGLILTMPLINFSYFTASITLNFPVSEQDRETIEHFINVNNREIFVNAICRRRYEFFLEDYVPDEEEITPENAMGDTKLLTPLRKNDSSVLLPSQKKCAIMSSGGKESLLTLGMMDELGAQVFPFFFNESGRHWYAAIPAYRKSSVTYPGTRKVWSNVDRFYTFMIRNMRIINRAVLKKTADSYPIQLFIFPVYIFSFLPLLMKYKIGNVILGDEFDDPMNMGKFHGMTHYYGIYDQTNEFNSYLTSYFNYKGLRIKVWSAVYPISGMIVEKILMERYPKLFELQRSCHSCRIENGQVLPCGKCTKCLGIMLFILSNRGDPSKIGYLKDDYLSITDSPEFPRLRLDPDEVKMSMWGARLKGGEEIEHVAGIHMLPGEIRPLSLIPDSYRDRIMGILKRYTLSTFRIRNRKWVRED